MKGRKKRYERIKQRMYKLGFTEERLNDCFLDSARDYCLEESGSVLGAEIMLSQEHFWEEWEALFYKYCEAYIKKKMIGTAARLTTNGDASGSNEYKT